MAAAAGQLLLGEQLPPHDLGVIHATMVPVSSYSCKLGFREEEGVIEVTAPYTVVGIEAFSAGLTG